MMAQPAAVPASWVIAPLGEVADVRLGKMLSRKAFQQGLVVLPYLRNENVRWGSLDLSDVKSMGFKSEEIDRYQVLPLDLLVCEGGEPGRCAVYRGDQPVMYQKALHRVRPYGNAFSPSLMGYWFEHLAGSGGLASKIAQTTIQHLPLERIRALELPLPPRREQDEIVGAIEQQLSRIEAGVAGLERVKKELVRYRASVLKAACEGRLVPTEAALARAEGRAYEPALEHEKTPSDQGQQSPAGGSWSGAPDTSDLPAVPEGWIWIHLGSVVERIEAGKSFKCDEHPPGTDEVGVLKVSAVTWGEYDEDESKTCTDPLRIDSELFVREGDFLFSRANTVDLVGACVISGVVRRRIMLSDKILRFEIVSSDKRWILFALRSKHGRQEIERLATGNQESMRNIGQKRIRSIRIPLPPVAEQLRIVAEVERRLSIADEIATTIGAALARAARLRQSILKRAFEGKLVPQDPNDEPASVLLERIRKERVTAVGERARRIPARAPRGRRARTRS